MAKNVNVYIREDGKKKVQIPESVEFKKIPVRENLKEIKIREELDRKHIENDFSKKNLPDEVPEPHNPATTHMLLTVEMNGLNRIPEVGEKITCHKQHICSQGCDAILATNCEGAICGHSLVNSSNVLHGTVLDNDKFAILPLKFEGTVVEHGMQNFAYLIMIVVEVPVANNANTFTVVSPGNTLLAAYGSTFTAKREPRLNGCASVFGVYDGCRKIGIIAPIHRLAIPGTDIVSLLDANKYPDEFKVKVVGDGQYDDLYYALRVEFLLKNAPKPATGDEVAAADKKILKKYLAYLLREGECSTRELMMLSENGKQKKAMLDKKYKDVMQGAADKLNAYFALL